MTKKQKHRHDSQSVHHPIEALEHALRVYENATYAIDLIARAQKLGAHLFPDKIGYSPITTPPGHRRFRDFLLDAATTPFDVQNIAPYGGVLNHSLERYPEGFKSFIKENVPVALYRWSACSRRVFDLSNDLQLLLQNTDVKDVRISDVPWPFSTFAITIPQSLMEHADVRCILVNVVHDPEEPDKIRSFYIRLFPAKGAPHLTLELSERQDLERLFRQRKWQNLQKRLVPHMNAWSAYQVGYFGTPCNVSVNTCYEEHFDGDAPKLHTPKLAEPIDEQAALNAFPTALNLAIGLSFYLSMLPANSTERSSWSQIPASRRTSDPRAISHAADVCSVSSTHVLTPEERRAFSHHGNGTSSYELCAHFRRGHWRRPPGRGKDTTAEKIVWVRPTLVRRDRLGPGELPGGTRTILP